ncbi:MAG TPA: hypothetical protein VFU43_09890 [Streptosporangiaceae bacterium]|nr:hypothetical protein [Streptosporangiaceae bacterium]
MTTVTATAGRFRSGLTTMNTSGHKLGLQVFLFIVLAHWAEHIVQAIQIWVLGRPVPESRGVLGEWFPWLVKSEALHYGYAIVMLAFFILLRNGFTGASRTWWNIALGIQVWHHFEHLLLLIQAQTGWHLAGKPVPTSIIQLVVPRVELHLAYNSIVFIPMVVAMILHRRPAAPETGDRAASCNCAPARA